MRLTGTCWSCTIALAAVFLPATWAIELEERADRRKRSAKLSKRRSNSWPKGAQKVVEGESYDEEGRGLRKSTARQPVHGLAPTPRPTNYEPSATDISAPAITEGPSLMRRKVGSMRWSNIHDGLIGKRDGTMCPASYQLCPSSLGGGCCPSDGYSCGTSSCLPTSASPASACGFSGYVACGIADGGGCCPGGYLCAFESCSPSPGVTSSLTCGVDSFQCPASLGGGCCKNGMGCALSACYNTNPVTFTLTETFTTTGVTLTSTITSTTVSTPDPTATVGVLVPKVQPSATPIAKQQATSAASSGGGGLSTAALGGIIGGAIFFLTAILIAAIFIIRGLNKATKAQREANSRASGSNPSGSGRSGQRRGTLDQDMDSMSIDPLMIQGSTTSGSYRHRVSSQSPHTTLPEMEGSGSPPVLGNPFSPRSPPHTHYPRGYNTVPGSESQYSHSSGGHRNPSLDSTPPMSHNQNGYFDLPVQHNHRVSLISSQGRRPSHGRNYSNSSEVSQSSSLGMAAELDAGKDGPSIPTPPEGRERGSSISKFVTRLVGRRQSDSPVLTGGPVRVMGDKTPSPREGGGLGYIAEAGESKLAVDLNALQQSVRAQEQEPPQTPFQDISLMDQPVGFRRG